MNKKIRDSHLALELLHDVEESVVDIWLVVELDLESEEGEGEGRWSAVRARSNLSSRHADQPTEPIATLLSIVWSM